MNDFYNKYRVLLNSNSQNKGALIKCVTYLHTKYKQLFIGYEPPKNKEEFLISFVMCNFHCYVILISEDIIDYQCKHIIIIG